MVFEYVAVLNLSSQYTSEKRTNTSTSSNTIRFQLDVSDKSGGHVHIYTFAKNSLIFEEHILKSDRCSIIPHDLYSNVSVHVYVLQILKVGTNTIC